MESEETIKFIQDLVKTQSVNGNETKVAERIKKKLNEYGVKSEFMGEEDERLNLVATLGTSKKSLMLCGHMDTVHPGDRSKWKYDPFSGKYDKGKIYGRGAYDMKGSLAAMVSTAIEVKRNINGKLILAFTIGEESGGHAGIRYLMKKGVKANKCIVTEPTKDYSIVKGSRGIYRFEIIVRGQTAHTGSTSGRGVNAVMKMAYVLLKLSELKPKYQQHKLFPPHKITPGTLINGGVAVNIVPDYCKAAVDYRLTLGQKKDVVIKEVKNYFNKLQKNDFDLKVEINNIVFVPPVFTGKDEIIDILAKNYEIVLGKKPEFRIMGGVTDGNITVENRIPTVIFGPTGDNAHSENEFVDVDSVLTTCKIYERTVCDFLGG